MQIAYDPRHLRLVAARTVNAARGALLQYNPNIPGVAMIALASAEPITIGGEAVLALDFERRNSRGLPLPRIRAASVEGRSAEVIDAEVRSMVVKKTGK